MRPINKRPDRTELERQVGRLKGLTYILAILLATSLIVLSIWVANPINDNQHQSDRQDIHQHNEGDKEHDLAESTRWLFDPEKPLASTGDTIADWVSTAFTALAFGVLVWNLFLTRSMVNDTRSIGQAQVRAYPTLDLDQADIIFEHASDKVFATIHCRIKNHGQSPARRVRVRYTFCSPGGIVVDTDMLFDSGAAFSEIPAGGQSLKILKGPAPYVMFDGTKTPVFRLVGFIEYIDVFGDEQRTDWFSAVLDRRPNRKVEGFLIDRDFTQ